MKEVSMRHPKGFIPVVIVVFMAVIAAGLVAAALYYNQHKDEAEALLDTPDTSLAGSATNADTNSSSSIDDIFVKTIDPNKPVIIYPVSGSTISEYGIVIQGTTNPNYYVRVYANYLKTELNCITRHTYASGGAGQADENGDFVIHVPSTGYNEGINTYVAAASQSPVLPTTCLSASSVSDDVEFTYTGSLPNS